jgi:hypothetical protein
VFLCVSLSTTQVSVFRISCKMHTCMFFIRICLLPYDRFTQYATNSKFSSFSWFFFLMGFFEQQKLICSLCICIYFSPFVSCFVLLQSLHADFCNLIHFNKCSIYGPSDIFSSVHWVLFFLIFYLKPFSSVSSFVPALWPKIAAYIYHRFCSNVL